MTEEELTAIESGLSEALLFESIDGEVGRRYPWAVQLWTDIGNLLDEVRRLGQRSRLEAAVIETALAERRAYRAYDEDKPGRQSRRHQGVWDNTISKALTAAEGASNAAGDALLAFLEDNDGR